MTQENKSKPGPKPGEKKNTLVEGTVLGIRCGWDNQVIPPDQIYELAVLGLTNKEMANFYGVSDATIARNFAAELQKGREMTKIKLRRAMMKNATEHMNAAVQIFLAKAVLGMSESNNSTETVLPWVENKEEESLDEENSQH